MAFDRWDLEEDADGAKDKIMKSDMNGNLHNKQYNYKEREANETEKGAVLIIIIFQSGRGIFR